MFVRSWMSSPVHALAPDTRAIDAFEFMRVKRIRRVPVAGDGAVDGIVTLGDLQALLGLHADAHARAATSLADIMTRPVFTVAPSDTLEHAAAIMLEREVSGLPVVEYGRLLGIITESDIFSAFNRVMGVASEGARLVLTLPQTHDLLEGIRLRLGRLALESLAAWRRPEGDDWEVVMRVRSNDPAAPDLHEARER
jgi:acetoin utilization protein AcuB